MLTDNQCSVIKYARTWIYSELVRREHGAAARPGVGTSGRSIENRNVY
jgi:hypothetical protein